MLVSYGVQHREAEPRRHSTASPSSGEISARYQMLSLLISYNNMFNVKVPIQYIDTEGLGFKSKQRDLRKESGTQGESKKKNRARVKRTHAGQVQTDRPRRHAAAVAPPAAAVQICFKYFLLVTTRRESTRTVQELTVHCY
ncbi:unnamed protein product [Euphydryas editha]|uniref:Uncharacterized protein n=1 Tax=Euphydryas editha TaxID=104508 RepID=A0AAU9UYJ4_EUPED|nr:unnamed protein product [Euphydryas editha]